MLNGCGALQAKVFCLQELQTFAPAIFFKYSELADNLRHAADEVKIQSGFLKWKQAGNNA